MAEVFGERPRPWVIVVGIPRESELGSHILRLAPTCRFVEGEDDARLRQSDYDAAIVVANRLPSLDPHLHVLAFGAKNLGVFANLGQYSKSLSWRAGQFAGRFVVEEAATKLGVGTLASALIPGERESYEVLSWDYTGRTEPLVPLVSEVDGDPLAGVAPRRPAKNSGEIWILPARADAHAADWVTAAFRRWSELDEQAFPVNRWATESAWQTAQELEISAEIAAFAERATRLASELATERAELERRFEIASQAGDIRERALLTSNGEALVESVAACLSAFGFVVVDSDESAASAGTAKEEDLRISDGDWVCLCEVKGYRNRNARATDLMQVNKAVETFVLREQRQPDARWYIVNQSFGTPPAQRSQALQGSDALEIFAASQGLVIDTRDLFKLWQAVGSGAMTPLAARELLKSSTGRLTCP